MRLRRIKNDDNVVNESGEVAVAEEEWTFAEHEPEYQPNGGGGGEGGILGLIRKKRHLIDNCFEDENYGVEPC